MFYVYVIQNEDHEIYIGSTNDLRKRFREHNAGKSYATRGYFWRLVYYEAYLSESDAREREQRLKHYGQALRQLKDRKPYWNYGAKWSIM